MIFLLLVSVSSESVPLQVGRIIGKGGTNVREMQRITGAVIKLPEQVCHCRKAGDISLHYIIIHTHL